MWFVCLIIGTCFGFCINAIFTIGKRGESIGKEKSNTNRFVE